MNKKKFIRPPYDPRFDHTNIISWKFRRKPTPDHGKYTIRFTLITEDGSEIPRQIGGFKSLNEAIDAKDVLIGKLSTNKYIPYKFTLEEFYTYWLYYYMIDEREITYNTFTSYFNIIKYLYKFLGEKTLIDNITSSDIIIALERFPTKSLRKLAYTVIGSSFLYAKCNNIIEHNFANKAIKITKKKLSEANTAHKKNYFTIDEIITLLVAARKKDFTLYMLMLLSATTGTRISETIAICFSSIDFFKNTIKIDCQLGRTFNNEGYETDTLLGQKIRPKTNSSSRTVPVPEFIMDELVLAKIRHDKQMEQDPDFLENSDFVLSRGHGYPLTRGQGHKLNLLMEECGITPSQHVWHDFRHSYATILSENKMNEKVISKILGHKSKEFTQEVYVIHKQESLVYDSSEEMENFIASLNLPSNNLPSNDAPSDLYDLSDINQAFEDYI